MNSPSDYKTTVMTGQYKTASFDDKQMIQHLFGEDTEQKFNLYFHWYNMLHELGHAIFYFNCPSRPHPAEEEQKVNDFAMAYHRFYGETVKLQQLCQIVQDTIHRFTPPNPSKDYMTYAKDVWGSSELNTFNNYGWFQFSCVKHSIENPILLEEALHNMGVEHLMPQDKVLLEYEMDDEMPIKVVNDAVKNILRWGAIFPEQVEVKLVDDPNCHMCVIDKK